MKLGLVTNLARPGGNATGANFFTSEVEAKRLGLLHELAPGASVIAAVLNPTNANAEYQSRDLTVAAHTLGLELHVLNASSADDIAGAFARAVELGAGALLVASDPFLFAWHQQVIALAARHALPAIYEWRQFAEAGGLASYGTSLMEAYRQAGVYTGRIVRGEKPADLPVQRSTKFEFVINLKTAKALGLAVPNSMQLLADEVIE
jgi:putative ABC transport system substrate-binding protein